MTNAPPAQPGRTGRARLSRVGRAALVPTLVAAVTAAVVALATSSFGQGDGAAAVRAEGTESLATAEFEEATGIRVVRITPTAAGGLVDLRYQVLDPDKALVVHDQDRPPAVLGENGVLVAQRWHDHLTTRALKHAVVYHELLVNTAGAVRSGDEVSLLVGDWRLDGVEVE